MKICAKKQGNDLYIELIGEIDEHNAALCRKEADKLVEAYAGCERAVFVLRDISFMDSTGIGFLIGRYKKFTRFGIPVYIAAPPTSVDKILSMSGVYTLMPRI